MFVYSFNEGHKGMRDLLGGKGANLAEMTRLSLPVPPGFTITTIACREYLQRKKDFFLSLHDEIKEQLAKLERDLGKSFGAKEDPLLVSVRSGAAVSMPGMMDTILNLGLTDATVPGLIRSTGDRRFVLDCYRRLIQMYAEVVMGVAAFHFSRCLEDKKKKCGIDSDHLLAVDDLEALIKDFKGIVDREAGTAFPQDPPDQLFGAVEAVFNSWNTRRAIIYRRAHNIADDLGTAVNIQAMVFGNKGDTSGTGVLFTRDPATGAKVLYGEFLLNAQGEDVVAGIRTPLPLREMKEYLPAQYTELEKIVEGLEKHYHDVQDVEFTIEEGRLFILQTRNAKRTAQAAVKTAVDMADEGIITREEAILRVPPEAFEKILHRQIDEGGEYRLLAKGLAASPGAASGRVVFDPDEAERLNQQAEKVILVTLETAPDDIHGMLAAQGILTARGGMTSHAAVVARGMGKPAICGCEEIKIDKEQGCMKIKQEVFREGDWITINGSTGQVIAGEVPMKEPELSKETYKLLGWADEARSLDIRVNADNAQDAKQARLLGAEGIGLCRTEHMFMGRDRLPFVQKLILGETVDEREEALAQLLSLQKADFYEILAAMEGLPVTVRLLDPPLHEFLPDLLTLQEQIFKLEHDGKKEEASQKRELFRRTRNMSEANPMLGLRGCRLGIIMPALYEMQVKALFSAGCELVKQNKKVIIEVMVPLVAEVNELSYLRSRLERVIKEEITTIDGALEYKIGTMIELPRACLTAKEIAREADFFSFGTNDLTQTTYGFSRDDAESKFLHTYLEEKILAYNPFVTIDQAGVGRLISIAVREGKETRKDLKVGICGEHGGEAQSIAFCHRQGLDYVSCSPYRVPVARLAAAQAKIQSEIE